MSENIKNFIIKLIAITISIIIVINILFNILIGERLQKIDNLISLNDSNTRDKIRNKIRKELVSGLEKDEIFSEEDKILLYKLYLKIENEFKDIRNQTSNN